MNKECLIIEICYVKNMSVLMFCLYVLNSRNLFFL